MRVDKCLKSKVVRDLADFYIQSLKYFLSIYYGPSVINVTVTKGGHLRGSRLYGTSGTIRRGVS